MSEVGPSRGWLGPVRASQSADCSSGPARHMGSCAGGELGAEEWSRKRERLMSLVHTKVPETGGAFEERGAREVEPQRGRGGWRLEKRWSLGSAEDRDGARLCGVGAARSGISFSSAEPGSLAVLSSLTVL